jgi:septum formation protein
VPYGVPVSIRPVFVLASASPARLKLLRAAGFDPQVVTSGVDESTVECADPVVLCATLAQLKAEAVVDRLPRLSPTFVLGCDSMLEFDGEVLGKPRDAGEARQRWRAMRGRSGILHTGHCLLDLDEDRTVKAVASTTVYFGEPSDAEVDAYVRTGEPVQVAGAFTIDGLGGWFVDRIDGDPGTVIGVSLPLLRRLLHELDTGIEAFWELH